MPVGPFGWLDDRLLHDGRLAQLGVDGVAVMTLLALAADRKGASFYGRARMADRLGLPVERVGDGLRRLLDLGLVAFRPWREGTDDGVWQLLPVPATATRLPSQPNRRPPREPTSIAEELSQLGLHRGIRDSPSDSRGS